MGLFSKKSLGIDIGASSIKIVEISVSGNKKKLENYLEFKLPINGNNLKTFHQESLLLLSDETAMVLQPLLKRGKIRGRRVSFSIPDFSTFFTTFNLPPMTENEIPQAIEFEARHHIPIPLSEVTLDWQIIEKEQTTSGGVKLKVLLVAVPNSVLKSYQRMASLAQLEISGMEAEVFSLIRACYPSGRFEHAPLCMVDIGQQSTTVSIVEERKLLQSFSFDFSSAILSKELALALQVSLQEAETLKIRFGLDPQREDVNKVLLNRVELLAGEIEKVCLNFYQHEGKKIDGVMVSGGASLLFGLKEYLATRLKKEVWLANPFNSISCPEILSKRLKTIGPSFSIAVGTALMAAET